MKIVKPDPITTTGYVTRNSQGRYYNSEGYLTVAGYNALRLNYNPATLEFTGLLIEDSSTNLITYTPGGPGWSSTGVTFSAATSPENALNATKITPTIVTSKHGVSTTVSGVPNNSTYSYSVFLKNSGYSKAKVGILSTAGSNQYESFFVIDLINGVSKIDSISDGITAESYIEKLRDNWYRVGISVTLPVQPDTIETSVFAINNEDQEVFSGDQTSGILSFGYQLEAKEKMTSYIGNSYEPLTRAAEVITGSGLLYTNVTNPYPEWSSSTTYSLGQIVVVGTYTGSNIVNITNSGTYKSLTNSNLNNNPVTSPTSWVRIGPTNQFAVFDNVISSSTVKSSDIIFVVKSASVDSISVLNSVATKISCTVSDASYLGTFLYNIAYNRTTQLNGDDSIDWFSYFFFDEYAQKTQAIYLDVPQVSNGIVSIKISGAVNVSAGSFINGQVKVLGATQYGASAGITDYSKKEVDEFGNTVLVVRNYSKRMQAKVFLSNSNLNTVQRILYSIRATPVLWIASNDSQLEEPLIVMGYYKDFDTEIAYPAHSLCNLTIEGLI